MYIAGHPILMVCDTKKETNINEHEIELILTSLKMALLTFIPENTEFDPFLAEIMYTNLSDRLKGDQLLISWKVGYLTDLLPNNKFKRIKSLDKLDFLHYLKNYPCYKILENILELDTFVLHIGEYKDMEFAIEINNDF